MSNVKYDFIIGGRSDLIRAASLKQAASSVTEPLDLSFVHTGEDLDPEFTPLLMEQLNFQPDEILPGEGFAGSALFAEVLLSYEQQLQLSRPKGVVIMGNSQSSTACALAAARQGVEIIHLDAGNRHYDKKQVSEQNDLIIDQLATFMITSNGESVINLMREGVDSQQMIDLGSLSSDTVLANLGYAEDSHVLDAQGLVPSNYVLIALSSAYDDSLASNLASLVLLLERMSENINIHLVLGEESRRSLEEIPEIQLESTDNFNIVSGHGYHEMLKLMKNATLILTDSQSIQEETTILGVPCLTLGYTTNRPVTLAKGTNLLVGYNAAEIEDAITTILSGEIKEAIPIDTWDGKVAFRILEYLSKRN